MVLLFSPGCSQGEDAGGAADEAVSTGAPHCNTTDAHQKREGDSAKQSVSTYLLLMDFVVCLI